MEGVAVFLSFVKGLGGTRMSLLCKQKNDMKRLVQLEEMAQLATAFTLLYLLPLQLSWWAWLLLFFAPDVSMIGYTINHRVGGLLYNIVHHKGSAAVLLVWGLLAGNVPLQAAGLLLWAHSSFDRVMGYGLKYPDHFTHTHLGRIGKKVYAVEVDGTTPWGSRS